MRQPAALDEADVERWAGEVLGRMSGEPERSVVCIRLVDEPESREINARFRGVEKPTNVLSFPADVGLPDTGQRVLGDIVICDPVVRREAREQGKALLSHYAHMVVHGMLHLYGYDHEDPAEAEVMEGLEREILGRMGIADPYREG